MVPQPHRTPLYKLLVDQYHGSKIFDNSESIWNLRQWGFDVETLRQPYTPAALRQADLLVIWFTRTFNGTLASFTDADIQMIHAYLNEGGNVFLIGLGWVWADFEDKPSIGSYPLNQIAAPYGIFYTKSVIREAGTHYQENPIAFHKPFMAAHPITTDINRIEAAESVPGSLLVQPPAVPLIWGNDQLADGEGRRHPVMMAASEGSHGRLVCLQHSSYVEQNRHDNFALLRNTLNWLVKTPPPSLLATASPANRSINKVTLAEKINQKFDLQELQALCFQLEDVEYDNLSGETKNGRVIALLEYLDRRDRLAELIPVLQKERPNVTWP